MSFDALIVFVYLGFVVLLGLRFSRANTFRDFFLGNRRIPWFLATLSIVATETSALTVISLPGIGYTSGMGFLQIAFGYFVGRIIVSIVFLPSYLEGDYFTVYQFLEKSFGSLTKKIVSLIFHITRVLADGVRLFATSIPLTFIMGWDFRFSIALIMFATLIYTMYGGIGSVVVTDSLQLVVYLAGGLLAMGYLLFAPEVVHLRACVPHDFFTVITLDGIDRNIFFSINIISGIVGGAFVSLASHGTDHLIVQRALAVSDLKSARKAMIASGVIVIFQFALFLALGILIRAHLCEKAFARSDEVMPYFMVHNLPTGIRGIFLAGIFASAMSTISSSINSLSSSTCIDLFELDRKQSMSQRRMVMLSRAFSLLWGLILCGAAVIFKYSSKALVEIALSIASIAYGGILGVFVMERWWKGISKRAVVVGMCCGILSSAYVALSTSLHWLFYIAIGSIVSVAVAAFFMCGMYFFTQLRLR
ncbi:MAG: sodium/solute symporter [Spirochaetes bacterium]|nr:sodium/solute symporter [Spirochaetota bacterium]